MRNRIYAEFFGTALLLAVVVGSGVMGEALGAGNAAVALLGNSIATGCGLYVLVTLLLPVSGAHINPAVSIMFWHAKKLDKQYLFSYLGAQFSGAVIGVLTTHFIFGLSILQVSTKPRHGVGIWLSELIATLVLLTVIRLGVKYAEDKLAMLIGLTVTAGYWFTSSTFFANPAVTIARSITNTFTGIQPGDVLSFISAQLVAVLIVIIMFKRES